MKKISKIPLLLLLIFILGMAAAGKGAEIKPILLIGTPAPALQVESWLRGEQVTAFVPGQTYVVEFWATWCAPCVQSIPHLIELQNRYKGKVTFVSIAASERGASAEEKLKTVQEFLAHFPNASKLNYAIGFDSSRQSFASWAEAAAVNGIPLSFVVNGEGKVVYIGHPAKLDKVLDKVVQRNWETSRSTL